MDELAIRPSDIGQKAWTLSGGNQQKVVIAKWLLSRTRVLLLDEPTRGVDIGAKVEIYHIINGLVEAGIGVLLISSEMSEVLGMSDRIIVMREGRLVGNLTRAEADEEKLLRVRRRRGRGGHHTGEGNNMKATLPLMERARQMVRLRWSDFIFMGIFVVLILISSLISETFFTTRNLINISRQIVTNGLISLGMLIVMLTGGVDLSVGSIVAICGIIATGLQNDAHPVAILVALMVGTTVGMANGFFIARFKLQPFIVTLATMGIIRGATYVYSETPQSPVDPLFRSLLGGGFVGPIPRSAIIMLAFFIVVWFFLNRTIPGRAVVAIGGTRKRCGLPA